MFIMNCFVLINSIFDTVCAANLLFFVYDGFEVGRLYTVVVPGISRALLMGLSC